MDPDCNLHGHLSALDEIAHAFLEYRPEGGRFFISNSRSRVFTKGNELAAKEIFLILEDK